MLEILSTRNYGRVTLTIGTEADYSPDYSYLGEFSNYKHPRTIDEKLVDRRKGIALDHRGIWRNERGHIQPAPEILRGGGEYQYTFHSNGCDRVKYALEESARMEELERGNWYYLGVSATVTFDGAEIGRASLWGIESDSGDSYIQEEARNMAHEALRVAKGWRTRNCAT